MLMLCLIWAGCGICVALLAWGAAWRPRAWGRWGALYWLLMGMVLGIGSGLLGLWLVGIFFASAFSLGGSIIFLLLGTTFWNFWLSPRLLERQAGTQKEEQPLNTVVALEIQQEPQTE